MKLELLALISRLSAKQRCLLDRSLQVHNVTLSLERCSVVIYVKLQEGCYRPVQHAAFDARNTRMT